MRIAGGDDGLDGRPAQALKSGRIQQQCVADEDPEARRVIAVPGGDDQRLGRGVAVDLGHGIIVAVHRDGVIASVIELAVNDRGPRIWLHITALSMSIPPQAIGGGPRRRDAQASDFRHVVPTEPHYTACL